MKPPEIDRIECAIRHIKTSVDIDPWAVEIAVEAMEKQIPKKPYNSHYKQLNDEIKLHSCYRCVSCDHIIPYMQNYCGNCGQAIDWMEGEG